MGMRVLKDQSTTPPGGFVHTESGKHAFGPGTGEAWSEATFDILVNRVLDWLKSNKHPVPHDLERRLMEEQCDHHPALCRDEFNDTLGPKKKYAGFSWQEVFGAGQVFGHAIKALAAGESPFVSLSEAERRSSICATCSHNVEPDGCAPCGLAGALSSTMSWLSNRSTSHDSSLRACVSCGCMLKGKVHLKKKILHAHTHLRSPYHPSCWMLEKE
jgi:hypothetical protein